MFQMIFIVVCNVHSAAVATSATGSWLARAGRSYAIFQELQGLYLDFAADEGVRKRRFLKTPGTYLDMTTP